MPDQDDNNAQANVVPIGTIWDELSIARHIAARVQDQFHYVQPWGKWLAWDGEVWSEDTEMRLERVVSDVCEALQTTQRSKTERKRLGSSGTVAHVINLLRSMLIASEDQWDLDPVLLNTKSGVVELRTGQTRSHSPHDFMRKITQFGLSTNDCPLWKELLNQLTGGSQEYISYLQCALGYSTTGLTIEQKFWFLWGTGGNGKSLMLEVVAEVLGDYARSTDVKAFTVGMNEIGTRHPADLAALDGARFVTATEPGDDDAWNEILIKKVTGGDTVSARLMRENPRDFKLMLKLWFAGNARPGLRVVDKAITRRLIMMDTQDLPDEDVDLRLKEKLMAEGDAILRWLVEGAVRWHRDGLFMPDVVREMTDTYFAEANTLQTWIDERCIILPEPKTSTTDLWRDYKPWIEDRGQHALALNKFSRRLERLLGNSQRWKKRANTGAVWALELNPKRDPVYDMGRPSLNDATATRRQ